MTNMPQSVAQHEKAGRYVSVRGHNIFVRDEGQGQPIVLVHGVPSSSYLYRKMIPRLTDAGYRAISFDLVGMGLSDKPANIDYDWHSLSQRMGDTLKTLGLPPVHLVVHDIGGPIGLEWAINHPQDVHSITITNTLMDPPVFKKPFPMWLYSVPILRHVAFITQNELMFKPIMQKIGVYDASAVDSEMIKSYLWLLRNKNGRQPFLDIMDGFDLSKTHADFLAQGAKNLGVPIQMIWGEEDKAIPKTQANYIIEKLDINDVHWVQGRHFLQEDQAEQCVQIDSFCKQHFN